MRYAIISDIHSNLEALEAAVEVLSREKIDRYLCVGDIVGYGADPCECIKRTKALDPIIVCGNHDAASSGLTDTMNFNKIAREAIIWTQKILCKEELHFLKRLNFVFRNKHFVLVHGTLQEPEAFHYMHDMMAAHRTFDLMQENICFIGHSHVPGIFSCRQNQIRYFYKEKINVSKGEKLIVNVGSIGQPRDGDPRLCYCIYDAESSSLELKRLPYDIEKAQKKILKAGLPPFLAYRLKMAI